MRRRHAETDADYDYDEETSDQTGTKKSVSWGSAPACNKRRTQAA